MNKFELRKLLAQLQEARQEVKFWPEDLSPCCTDVSPASNSAIPLPCSPFESSPFHSSLERFWKTCMKTAFLPPEEQLEIVIEITRKKFAEQIPLPFAIHTILWVQPQFTAIHYRLARAVEHIGERLHPLAATVGAIRLNDSVYAKVAAQHLAAKVSEAHSKNDKDALSRIEKLQSSKLGNHRNYQIWIAIEEVMKHQSRAAKKASPQTKSQDDSANEIEQADFSIPTTTEIRRYVEAHANHESFSLLPGPKQHSLWTRLWQESGASQIITAGVRGSSTRTNSKI